MPETAEGYERGQDLGSDAYGSSLGDTEDNVSLIISVWNVCVG